MLISLIMHHFLAHTIQYTLKQKDNNYFFCFVKTKGENFLCYMLVRRKGCLNLRKKKGKDKSFIKKKNSRLKTPKERTFYAYMFERRKKGKTRAFFYFFSRMKTPKKRTCYVYMFERRGKTRAFFLFKERELFFNLLYCGMHTN